MQSTTSNSSAAGALADPFELCELAAHERLMRVRNALDVAAAAIAAARCLLPADRPEDQIGDGIGLPAKNAPAFSRNRVTEACIASGERPAICGVSTTLGKSINSAGGWGSLS